MATQLVGLPYIIRTPLRYPEFRKPQLRLKLKNAPKVTQENPLIGPVIIALGSREPISLPR